MARETRVQSQVESYQKLKKWYLIPPCLTPSIIRYVSRVKWSHSGKRVALSPTSRCSSYWPFGSTSTTVANFILLTCPDEGLKTETSNIGKYLNESDLHLKTVNFHLYSFSFTHTHTRIYIYIYIGSIFSLMQISLNIIDILCLHIFFWIRSNSRIPDWGVAKNQHYI